MVLLGWEDFQHVTSASPLIFVKCCVFLRSSPVFERSNRVGELWWGSYQHAEMPKNTQPNHIIRDKCAKGLSLRPWSWKCRICCLTKTATGNYLSPLSLWGFMWPPKSDRDSSTSLQGDEHVSTKCSQWKKGAPKTLFRCFGECQTNQLLPAPSSGRVPNGSKWCLFRVSIHHPLGSDLTPRLDGAGILTLISSQYKYLYKPKIKDPAIDQ